MDNQEIFNQIRELQKQRTLLSAQDTALVNRINELRDKIALKNIKKGYYTDNNGLFCKVYDIKEDVIFVYEVNTSELYATMEVYPYYRAFNNAYCRECTKEEYKVSNGYICTGDAWFGYCLPYNEETAHLLGTTDDWEGGEQ